MCRHDRGLIDRYFEGFCSPLDSRGSELTDEDAIRRTNLKVGDRAYQRGVEVQFGTTLWDIGVVVTGSTLDKLAKARLCLGDIELDHVCLADGHRRPKPRAQRPSRGRPDNDFRKPTSVRFSSTVSLSG
jgi:hypothetical protein